MGQAVMLKWTTKGVEGIKALITEINNYTYTNLEVLDLTGTPHFLLLTRSPHGRRRRSASRSSLFSRLVASEHFKYLPQVELLGLEFLRISEGTGLIDRSSIVREGSGDLQPHAAGSHAVHLHVAGSRESEPGRQLFSAVLRIYGLSNHRRCDHHSKAVPESFAALPISSIDNRFKSRGVMKLASLMADGKLPNLEILNLENNEIDEESTHFLSCSITSETVPNLQEFLIGGNPIGDKGVSHLFRYFRKNKVNFIKRLCLNGLPSVEGMMCRDSDGV